MLETVAETGSTNAELISRIQAGEQIAEGHWLIADRQTAGRGRLGRAWFDGAGNFMGSTVVMLRAGDPDPASLALMAGLALHATAAPFVPEEMGLILKWPNDLQVGGKKLSGILLERTADRVIVGIGVNLAVAPQIEDCATIALADLGPSPARDGFAAALAGQFAAELDRWRTSGLPQAIRRWVSLAHPEGTQLRVSQPDGSVITGGFCGLDPAGALQLRLADGSQHVIQAGDVHLLHGGD